MENINLKCGDSYKLIKDIPTASVDCIITDPPYEYNVKGFDKPINNTTYAAIKKLNIGVGIKNDILDEMVRVMKNVNIFIWCNDAQIYQYMQYFLHLPNKKINFKILEWHKANPPPMGGHFLPDTEYCLYFYEAVVIKRENKKIGSYWVCNTDWKMKAQYGNHPTMKPLNIIKSLITIASKRGDVIFDPFMGSGTTGHAAKELGRSFIGFEINEHFFKVSKNRIDSTTEGNNEQMGLF